MCLPHCLQRVGANVEKVRIIRLGCQRPIIAGERLAISLLAEAEMTKQAVSGDIFR